MIKRILIFIILTMLIFISACSSTNETFNLDACDHYTNKTISYLGDSITEFCNSEYGYIQYLDEHFHFKQSNNLGISGSTISGTASNVAFFQDIRVNSIPLDSDYILIYGGINDCWQNLPIGVIDYNNYNCDCLVGAYNTLIDKLKERFEYTTIIIVVPHYVNLANFTDYANTIVAVAKLNNIPYINLFSNSGINASNYKNYTTDGVHLNNNGSILVAECIGNFLINYR